MQGRTRRIEGGKQRVARACQYERIDCAATDTPRTSHSRIESQHFTHFDDVPELIFSCALPPGGTLIALRYAEIVCVSGAESSC